MGRDKTNEKWEGVCKNKISHGGEYIWKEENQGRSEDELRHFCHGAQRRRYDILSVS